MEYDPTDEMTAGEFLRYLREGRRIGVREIARQAKLSLSHIQGLEKDEHAGTAPTIRKLA